MGRAVSGLESSLAGTARMAGGDPAGREWAGQYDRAADEAAQAMSDAGRAGVMLGGLLEQSGLNHGRAEAHSDVSGKTPVPPARTGYAPGGAVCVSVPSASGGGMGAPAGWEWIQQLCGAVWPDGDTGRLRQAAAGWRAAAAGMEDAQAPVPGAVAEIRGQVSPEVDAAVSVCRGFGDGLGQLAAQARAIGSSCEALAGHIEKAHQDLGDQVAQFLEITAGIEAAGLIVGIFTAGIGEGLAQAGEAAEVAGVLARIADILAGLMEGARAAVAAIGEGAADGANAVMAGILRMAPRAAETDPAAAAGELDQLAADEAGAPRADLGEIRGMPDPSEVPLKEIPDELIDKSIVGRFDAATQRDGAVFWSGKVVDENGDRIPDAAMNGAQDLASRTYGTTLEGLLRQQGLEDQMPTDWADGTTKATWRAVSQNLAQQASGNVRAYVGNIAPASVWNEIEYPTLVRNPNVSSITLISAQTGRALYTYGR